MKINVSIDLVNIEDSDGTLSDWVADIIKAQIKAELKRSDKYKEFIKSKTEEVLDGLEI